MWVMTDYMETILKPLGVKTLQELRESPDFKTYCQRFSEDIDTGFRTMVESYIIHIHKQKN